MPRFPPFKMTMMTPKEQIEVERNRLKHTLLEAVYKFETETGLKVDALQVIRGASFGGGLDSKFLGVDVIIKL